MPGRQLGRQRLRCHFRLLVHCVPVLASIAIRGNEHAKRRSRLGRIAHGKGQAHDLGMASKRVAGAADFRERLAESLLACDFGPDPRVWQAGALEESRQFRLSQMRQEQPASGARIRIVVLGQGRSHLHRVAAVHFSEQDAPPLARLAVSWSLAARSARSGSAAATRSFRYGPREASA